MNLSCHSLSLSYWLFKNNFLQCILNEFKERFMLSNVKKLFNTPSLIGKMFFPTLKLETSLICMVWCLGLKFCCKFRSIQSSVLSESLYSLNSWIASLYFIMSIGGARLWILWSCSKDILRSVLLFKIFRALADADSRCCLSPTCKEFISQISQL